jgi:hypothetical protein
MEFGTGSTKVMANLSAEVPLLEFVLDVGRILLHLPAMGLEGAS